MSSTHFPSFPLRALLVLCALAVVSLLYLPLPILPQLAQAHGMGTATAAGVISAFGFAYATGFLIFGPLSDRLGRRTVMMWGLTTLSLVTVWLSTVEAMPLLLAGRAVQGLAAATFPPVAIAYLAERGTPRQRVWSVAWLSTAFLSAGLLGQIYGTEVAGRWGLGSALQPLAAVFALTAWCLWTTPIDAAGAPTSSLLAGYRQIGRILACPQLRRVYGPALLLLMCFVAFYMGLDTHLGSTLLAQGITPLIARELALPAFLAPLAVALVMPRYGAERVVKVGLVIATCGLALCAWAGDVQLYGLLVASVVFVAGVGISVPGLIARVATTADASVRGLAVAFYTFVLFVGASLGPWLAQQTVQQSTRQAFLVLAVLLGAATLYVMTGRRAITA
ncbi:MFS transporter [Vogesella fluminis]|uniref:Major facilitator superfamily protein n=1 Tax=Vogesella fluminis TaxID=1069161 RepID=A0ABQ3HD53_9NEIS|nr:MFS transporter [Vogesella fluminis]GHD79113.1 major facilitator superfamily protein [Vogesella fluminis]